MVLLLLKSPKLYDGPYFDSNVYERFEVPTVTRNFNSQFGGRAPKIETEIIVQKPKKQGKTPGKRR